jgi:hypothetical protein
MRESVNGRAIPPVQHWFLFPPNPGPLFFLSKEDHMGRPKGSKNKTRIPEVAPTDEPMAGPAQTWQLPDPESIKMAFESDGVKNPSPIVRAEKPAFTTITLTDEDLAPARQAKIRHEKAAAKYRRDEIASELRRKEIGEIEELSVPQVAPFDMSAAFTKIAQQKARAAGYRFVYHLRKTAEGWVFEASNVRVEKDAPTDQP